MKKTFPYKVWDIVYPLGIYYVTACITMFVAQLILGTSDENYMYCQILASLATIPFVYQFYRKDHLLNKIEVNKIINKNQLINTLWILLIAACIGIGLNNLIQMSPLVHISEGYRTASNAFYGSTIIVELIGSALITPLLEELLYRGIIYGRLRSMLGLVPSLLLSSFIFAFMHFNLVQFIYAFLLGMVLAMLMEKTGNMYAALIGHITANAIAVVRTETGLLQNTITKSIPNYVFAIVLLVLGLIMLFFCLKKDIIEN